MQDELPSCQEMSSSQGEYVERGLRDFLSCNANLVLLRTTHIYPRVDISEKLPQYFQHWKHKGCESAETDSFPLTMMRSTREQVDIVALGPDSYLWLKNTAKIHILIHTPNAGESDCSPRAEKSTYFGILHRLQPLKQVNLETHKMQKNSSDLAPSPNK